MNKNNNNDQIQGTDPLRDLSPAKSPEIAASSTTPQNDNTNMSTTPVTASASEAVSPAPAQVPTPAKTVFYQAAKPRPDRVPLRNNLNRLRPGTTSDNTSNPTQSKNPTTPTSPLPPRSDNPNRTNNRPMPRPNTRVNPNLNQGGTLRTPVARQNTQNSRPNLNNNNSNYSNTFQSHAPLGKISQINPITPQMVTRANASDTKLKIIPLGGLEEIGKNMTVFEYGNDIIIVDMGLMFPDSDMLGIDYIIPDVTYLEDKKDKIRGVFITHGHLDHTGATPYVIEKIGNPPIYGSQVTMGMIKQRLEEFGLASRTRLISITEDKDVIQLGVFRIFPFHLCHNIPGSIGLEIESPNGRIVLATDWKFDYTPADGNPVDFQLLASIGAKGVDLLMSDSTNAEKAGKSISEKTVGYALKEAFESASGRVIIAMFATNLSRIQQTLNIAHKLGRKVVISGRSMIQNVEMAVSIKAITLPPNTLIAEREMNRFPEEKLLIICTGSQGEDRSALMRMATGDHKVIKIHKGDTVIISASPIPGNEKSVSSIMDILYKAGAAVIYNKILDVHSSGHAYAEDLKLMLALIKPKYFLPIHGDRSKLILHSKLAEEVGVKPDNIMIGENGSIVEINSNSVVALTESHVPAGYVMVDGLGVGDVGNIVLRDRQAMAQEGIFTVIVVFDGKKKQFITSPDIISRGFIYMRENERFINDIRNEIKLFLKHALERNLESNQIKNELRDFISKLLYEKTERNPMVIPVIIEV